MRAPRCGWTRRLFLLSGLAASPLSAEKEKAPVFPAERRRYIDSLTEFEVERLTDPLHACYLPAYYGRHFSRRGASLLYWSDRAGSPQAFQMDLKSGESRQLTEAAALDGSSLTLLPDERSFCYFDGTSLCVRNLSNLRQREVYRLPEGWQRSAGVSVTEDGVAVFAEARERQSRLRMVNLRHGSARTVLETGGIVEHPLSRPRRAQILYRQGNEALWLVNQDGRQNRRLRTADGRIGPANWSPDGRTVLYLLFPSDPTQLHAIREHTPDQNDDKIVSKTSQFVHFGFNSNSSVFVGASANRASPAILLLLRMTRRELTVCEHRASDPAMVAPVFSPDSQRVYFQSDKDGKPAIYRLPVEKFVEKTDDDEAT
ncbi:MAG TPA: oligogalacturonate lyase family protein [Bryobacteraceae bacterium]|jgi:oligogalacturonide lyase|nr:oligogalacturonate lyase family protein [Bryobacteraceae bacterium]